MELLINRARGCADRVGHDRAINKAHLRHPPPLSRCETGTISLRIVAKLQRIALSLKGFRSSTIRATDFRPRIIRWCLGIAEYVL